jgi:uncharacterized protein
MSCREHLRLLDAYVDGELDLARSLALEEHVALCARCGAALARQRALRDALRQHVELELLPSQLHERLRARFGEPAARKARAGWRWGLAWAAPGFAALVFAAWLGFSAPAPQAVSAQPTRVVYHITSSTAPRAALRNLANHLNAAPDVRIVVVAHSEGVDFLLRGARDELGDPLEPAISRFRERGVEFRVCSNTLERRGTPAVEVIPAASLVPSGIAEIGRLQSREGYVYMRL